MLGVVFGVVPCRSRPLGQLPLGFVLDVFRSVPLLIQLVLVNSFNPILGSTRRHFMVSCVVLALYTAAVLLGNRARRHRAVPQTTRRAARSLGMTWWQDMRDIVFPLALRVSLPTWIGLTLGVMKDSALVWWIGVIELLRIVADPDHPHPRAAAPSVGLRPDLLPIELSHLPLGARLEAKWRDHD